LVADKEWHWYESWVKEVRKHCLENSDQYRWLNLATLTTA
jgi:hypothetical protein